MGRRFESCRAHHYFMRQTIIKNIATGITKKCDILSKNDNFLEVDEPASRLRAGQRKLEPSLGVLRKDQSRKHSACCADTSVRHSAAPRRRRAIGGAASDDLYRSRSINKPRCAGGHRASRPVRLPWIQQNAPSRHSWAARSRRLGLSALQLCATDVRSGSDRARREPVQWPGVYTSVSQIGPISPKLQYAIVRLTAEGRIKVVPRGG